MTLLERIRADVNGARILADWLGDGAKPLLPNEAYYRVTVCEMCPQNKPGHTFEENAAKAIKEQIGMAAEFGIHAIATPGHPDLHTCAVCNCYLPLKVWVPWKHLKNFTDPAKFPQNCWIPKEAANENTAQPLRPPP